MILVTGATGILGRVIVLELLKRGKVVRATKRKSSDLKEVRNSFKFYTENPDDFFSKIEWTEVNFDTLDSLHNALKGVEEVYHCAAKVSFHPGSRKEMYETNIVGTKNLLYACENSSVKKFCFVSSVAVLDGVNEDGKLDESSDFNSKVEHSPYAKSKHFAEMEVWRASAEGLDTVIVNPGVILGSGNWNSSSSEIFSTFEKYPYTMSGTTSYVDVRDVAKICVDLMEQNVFGERFILISENRKYSDIADAVRKKLGKSRAKILSQSILDFGYVLYLLFGWLFPKLRMMNRQNLDTVTSESVVSNEKILKKLNYQFIPVSESIDFHLHNYISDKNAK
ncbi:NAD-dependent epimerase/dehydratase family protein [Chryseobacterium sp.]|uniref:NAD-dependent epimerase/dehydratase family protein n=1 Tax=Chryseobacterium sp. TaxID=1871047 RepID=UPI0011CA72D6|nr:NAD-dependent epimerase/dehydratase family protein [Chryseobacterium sp.]TXF79357.1 NAD-dependent epimerase/dehydratase family protein [Chryseobacterium sp.]